MRAETKNSISSKRHGTYSRARRQFHLGFSTQRTRKGCREQEREIDRETGKNGGSLKESSPAFSRRHRNDDDDDDAGRRVASRDGRIHPGPTPISILRNYHRSNAPTRNRALASVVVGNKLSRSKPSRAMTLL